MIRVAGLILLLFAGAALACHDIPAPENGVLAVSPVLLPSPGVVVGDTLRDSTGRAAKLVVIAFGVAGEKDTVRTPAPTFILLDRGAHVTADAYLIGDSVRDTPVRVVGSVGTLQTDPASVDVTLRPDSIVSALTLPIDTIKFNLIDSTAAANLSGAIAVLVLSTGVLPPTPVKSVVIQFTLAAQPRALGNVPTGVLVDPANHFAPLDTTDATGQASRQVRVRPAALATPSATDSFVVVVSAQYRGVPLRGSPLRFVIPIQPGGATPARIP